MTLFALRAVDRAGNVGWFTGRAGQGWVSNQPGAAFTYEGREAAEYKAQLHNRFEAMHGLRFVVVEVRRPAAP